jgi:hypothetical protein
MSLSTELNRRDFLKLSGLAVLSAFVPACGDIQETPEPEFTREVYNTLYQYYPYLTNENPRTSKIFKPDALSEWVYALNYTSRRVDWNAVNTLYNFFETTTQNPLALTYTGLSNQSVTFQAIHRSDTHVLVFVPNTFDEPNFPDRYSSECGTLVDPNTNINISFVRFDDGLPTNSTDANICAYIEICQATVNVLQPYPAQEITCNSWQRAIIDTANHLLYPKYTDDARKHFLKGFKGEIYPLLILPQSIYDLIPAVTVIK